MDKTIFFNMDTRRILKLFALIGLASNIACTKNTLNLPEPASSLAGVYEVQNNQTPFPIKGQTLRLTVERVAADTVSVLVRAIVNGQPGDSLSYKRAFVGQEFVTINNRKGCVSYRVYINDPQGIYQLNMNCQEENVLNSFYKNSGVQYYTIVKFKRI